MHASCPPNKNAQLCRRSDNNIVIVKTSTKYFQFTMPPYINVSAHFFASGKIFTSNKGAQYFILLPWVLSTYFVRQCVTQELSSSKLLSSANKTLLERDSLHVTKLNFYSRLPLNCLKLYYPSGSYGYSG